MIIAVDFDGTIVEHKYPSIGKERPFATDALKQMAAEGHRLILWTVRSGELLDEAVDWCRKRGVEFYAVNSNQPKGSLFEHPHDKSPKVVADIYIDDSNLGGIPEWGEIYRLISDKQLSRVKHHARHKHFRWLRKLFGR